MSANPKRPDVDTTQGYVLDDQIGFVLRQVSQRHAVIFSAHMGEVTAMQWAVLAKLTEVGATSQNLLGRLTAMDVATVKGVVDRLLMRGLLTTALDAGDARRRVVTLTAEGSTFVADHVADAWEITEETVMNLTVDERTLLMGLLAKMR